jgi:hypothetical protein
MGTRIRQEIRMCIEAIGSVEPAIGNARWIIGIEKREP